MRVPVLERSNSESALDTDTATTAISNRFPKGKIKTDPRVPKSDMKPVRPLRGRFTHSRVLKLMQMMYTEEEFSKMAEAGVDKRMMFGTNPFYQAIATGEELRNMDDEIVVPQMPPSIPVAALILPRLDETFSLEGAKDPSNQMNFTPHADDYHGKLLHKYDEIVLGYASAVCSAHCRYCYRLDLFNKDTGKTSVRPEELVDYIRGYNDNLEINGGVDLETGERRFPIRELLLSGGDPMVLTNALLYRYLYAAGESGVHTLRIGSKEWAFRPVRFDDALKETLEIIHEKFPHMHVNFVSHLTHPDEFLMRDANGNHIKNEDGPGYQWIPASRDAVRKMLSLPFVSVENQTPIISRVNDNEEALRILHEELRRMGVKPKYIFQGRDIQGHKAFSVPVEKGWKMHNEAMKGVSDTVRSRFAMSTEWGKMEVISLIDGITFTDQQRSMIPTAILNVMEDILGDGLIVFKSHRSPHEAESQGDLVIAKRNPEALWISGYEDRILYDTRKGPNGAKYNGLIDMVIAALGQGTAESFFASLSEDRNKRWIKDFANDPERILKVMNS